MDTMLFEILPWVKQGECCSQLIMRLALQASGEENPALVRSQWGFCQGMAYAGGPCGFLTGGVAVLGYVAGPGFAGTPDPHPMAIPLINDYVEWFRERTAQWGGADCPNISQGLTGGEAGPDSPPDMTRCGELLGECWEKIEELMDSYGLDFPQVSHASLDI